MSSINPSGLQQFISTNVANYPPIQESAVEPLPTEIVAAPVEGWRIWTLNQPESLTLTRQLAEGMAKRWTDGENPFAGLFAPQLIPVGMPAGGAWSKTNHARCHAQQSNSSSAQFWYGTSPSSLHAAPDQRCHCGFWAVKDRETVWEALLQYSSATVFGRVQLWGRVIEHKKGYRGEHARPVELWVRGTAEQATGLSEAYGCPVKVLDKWPAEYDEAAEKQRAAAAESAKANLMNHQQYLWLEDEFTPTKKRWWQR